MELGRCFIHSLGLPQAGPFYVLVESNEYLMGVWWGSCQKFCVFVVAMDTMVQVICWTNALVTCALEFSVQILPSDEPCGGGVVTMSWCLMVYHLHLFLRSMKGWDNLGTMGHPLRRAGLFFRIYTWSIWFWLMFPALKGREFTKSALAALKDVDATHLWGLFSLPKRVASGHCAWLLWSLTIKFVKTGRQRSSVTLMSSFLNRRVLPLKKRYPSWSLFADMKAGILDFSSW